MNGGLKKRGLALTITLLVVGVALTQSINANITRTTAQSKPTENLESEELTGDSKEQGSLQLNLKDYKLGLIKMLYMIGEYSLTLSILEIIDEIGLDNIEGDSVFLSEEEIKSIVISVVDNEIGQPSGDKEPTGVDDEELLTSFLEMRDDISTEPEDISSALVNMDIYAPLPGGEGLLRWILRLILEFIFNWDRGRIAAFLAEYQFARFGWINGVADFVVLQENLIDDIKYNLSPNVTRIEVIEETLEWFGYNFSVYDFIFQDLRTRLIDIAENRTRVFEGFGIRKEIYEQYILPLILQNVIPLILEGIYDTLNTKVGWVSDSVAGVKGKLKEFIKSFYEKRPWLTPVKRIINLYKVSIRFFISIFRLSIITPMLYFLYMDDDQVEEYKQDLKESITIYFNAWKDFINWMGTRPWREPITIQGNVTGLDPSRLDYIEVYCQDRSNYVETNADGYFEDLIFNTSFEMSPWILHECITTAVDTETSDQKTVDGLLYTGAFGGGELYLIINFSAEDNNKYIQSENDKATQQEQSEIIGKAIMENEHLFAIRIQKNVQFNSVIIEAMTR